MSRAGWCRECGAWVLVTDDGGCPEGHSAESVTFHYDSRSREGLEAPEAFGVGSMPSAVDRFNWGAFLIPALWGIGYGAWSLLGLWAIAIIVPLLLSALAGIGSTSQSVSANALIGVTVTSDTLIAFIRLWSGANANRLYWERESRRMELDRSAKPKVAVARFLKRQRLWVIGGTIGAVLSTALMAPSAYQLWTPYGLGWAAVAEPIVFLAAQIVLGFWLAHRMRVENPDAPIPAEEAS